MAKVFLRAYNREIETMIDRGQLDEAIAHCHHILKTFPKHLETYRLLGKAYLEGKRYGDAVDIFSRILASVPNDFVAQVGMSIIRDEENKLDDAIWHMERAFETQPSNAAIQSELQRLYGRRDGVQPPRIRMTRGALAHMYVQGELYPQAISEIKSVLVDDPGRSDMQALLARASFKSGAKNDAVDAALSLLQRHPYSLDANRVLVDVLSADRNENVQIYRQRVLELDPYASQVPGSIFLANEVPDAAVALERLDWNGQPVGTQSDWRESQAIGLESGAARNEEPDWMHSPFGETGTPPPSQPTGGSLFDLPGTPAQPADEIPDFLKAAGWGQSTGAFDESKPIYSEQEPVGSSQSIVEADLPDWVKAMKPPEPEPAQEQEEELPDWINKIGTGALSTSAPEQPDWMSPPDQEAQETLAQPADDQPDWLKGFGETEQPAQASQDPLDWLQASASEADLTPQPAQTDTSNWLKNLGSESEPAPASQADDLSWLDTMGTESEAAPAAASDDLDWLKGLGSESDITPQPAQTDTPDWLKSVETEPEPVQAAEPEDLDWLNKLGSGSEESIAAAQTDDAEWLNQPGAEPAAPAAASADLDFLNELTMEPVSQTAEEVAQPVAKVDELGKSEQERDDSFAWLEGLAAKQGASEGLLTKPEERLEEEPEWIRQAKGLTSDTSTSQTAKVEELGKTEQERDDSFAWLESLAAKQGASEGLLTKPEERLEEEPEWIKQAKGLTSAPVASQPPVKVEELGKSEQERDDSFAWLESLAAKQGASEGLLTKEEERLQEEPEWVRQARSVSSEAPLSQSAMDVQETGVGEEERDDSFAWLENLGAEQSVGEGGLLQEPEPAPSTLSEASVTDAPASASVGELGTSQQEQDDSFAWLESLAAKQGASEGLLTQPEERREEEPDWVKQAKDLGAQQPVAPAAEEEPVAEQPAPVEDTAAWLRGLDDEEKQPEPVATDETPAWLQDLEEEKQAKPAAAADQTAMWLKSLDQPESAPAQAVSESAEEDMPAWMQNLEEVESTLPQQEATDSVPVAPTEEAVLPSWLDELKEEERVSAPSDAEDLPAWLRGDEAMTETPEPTHATDWKPAQEQQPEIIYSPPLEEPKQPEIIYSPPLEETPQPEPETPLPPVSFETPAEKSVAEPEMPKPEAQPVRKAPSKPISEPVMRSPGTAMPVMPGVDQTLGTARSELSRSNIPAALESYARLIRKGRLLEEIIHDLREALYRYPVEISIWQALGDAYMRSNRLQDALDAYTKAEELLR